jgi:hypothetical protein
VRNINVHYFALSELDCYCARFPGATHLTLFGACPWLSYAAPLALILSSELALVLTLSSELALRCSLHGCGNSRRLSVACAIFRVVPARQSINSEL